MKMTLATGLLAGLMACALATSAAAGNPGATAPTAIAVRIADLDLRLPEDAARLDRRLQAALSKACPFERIRPQASATCRASAWDQARSKADRAIAAARQG